MFGSAGEPQMQPLTVCAIASAVVMVLGVSALLLRPRRDAKSRPTGLRRWNLHGSIPMAAAGLAEGAIARSSGQSATSHEILYVVSVTLLAAALLCATVGATAATRQRHGGHST
jgi:hypothetical protein